MNGFARERDSSIYSPTSTSCVGSIATATSSRASLGIESSLWHIRSALFTESTPASWTTSYYPFTTSLIKIPPTPTIRGGSDPFASTISLNFDPFYNSVSPPSSTRHSSHHKTPSTTAIALIVFFGLASIPISILFFYLTRTLRIRHQNRQFAHNDEWSSSWQKRHHRGPSGASAANEMDWRRTRTNRHTGPGGDASSKRSIAKGTDGIWRLSGEHGGVAGASGALPNTDRAATSEKPPKHPARLLLSILNLFRHQPYPPHDAESAHSTPPHPGAPLALRETELGRAWARPRRTEDVPDRVELVPAASVRGHMVAEPAAVRTPPPLSSPLEKQSTRVGVPRGVVARREGGESALWAVRARARGGGIDAGAGSGIASVPVAPPAEEKNESEGEGATAARRGWETVDLSDAAAPQQQQSRRSLRFSTAPASVAAVPGVSIAEYGGPEVEADKHADADAEPATSFDPATRRSSKRLSQAWRAFVGGEADPAAAAVSGTDTNTGAAARWSLTSLPRSEAREKRQSRGNRRYSMEEHEIDAVETPASPSTATFAAGAGVSAAKDGGAVVDAGTEVETDADGITALPAYTRRQTTMRAEEGDADAVRHSLGRKLSSPLAALERKLSAAQARAEAQGNSTTARDRQ